MKTIRVKKGYTPALTGAPAPALTTAARPARVALCPERLPFVKPRLTVARGDRVRLGEPLIEDKRNPVIRFLSPGGGRIEEIRLGPRRVIREIVVLLDDDEAAVEFASHTREDIARLDRGQLIGNLIAGGLWPLIRQLPFRDYADPERTPPALYVGLDNPEPFHPAAQIYLAGNEELLGFGLQVLQRLAEGRVVVHRHRDGSTLPPAVEKQVTLTVAGPHPAHDPATLVYHRRSAPEDNRAWFVDGPDVLLLARLLRDGRYPTERIVSVGGSGAHRPGHVLTRSGAPLSVIDPGPAENGVRRHIQGGALTGTGTAPHAYLGFYDTALTVLPQGNRRGELLGLFSPGYRKPTFSRAFLSAVHRDALPMDCNLHGGQRACIACGYCALVCPVDILPQFTYKAVAAGEVEEALRHGLLDCAECGLCTYVCPSKIELGQTLKEAKAAFYNEQARP